MLDTTKNSFGINLRREIKRRGLTYGAAADRLETSLSHLNKLMNGESGPSLDMILNIMTRLEIPANRLLNYKSIQSDEEESDLIDPEKPWTNEPKFIDELREADEKFRQVDKQLRSLADQLRALEKKTKETSLEAAVSQGLLSKQSVKDLVVILPALNQDQVDALLQTARGFAAKNAGASKSSSG